MRIVTIKVVVCGGVVTDVYGTNDLQGTNVSVIDIDNLKEQGLDSTDVDEIINEEVNGLVALY